MKHGDRVEVLRTRRTYHDVTPGMRGSVRNVYNGSVAVFVDGVNNNRSAYGCFYFAESMLRVIKEGDNAMLEMLDETMNVLNDYHNVVEVAYLNNHEKTFRMANYDPTIEIGDICVVKSRNHGLGIASVVDIWESNSEKLHREVVAKVDMRAFEERVKKRETTRDLMKKMEERSKELEKMILYKTLAASDPDMAALVKQYEEINNANKDM